MSRTGPPRRCSGCRIELSRYNDGSRCGACARDSRLVAVPELWESPQAREALATWDVGTLFRLYRRHTGATQALLAAAARIDQSGVSRLERGQKPVHDRKQLLAWTQALGIPDHLLGPLPQEPTTEQIPTTLWLPSLDDALRSLGTLTDRDIDDRLPPGDQWNVTAFADPLASWRGGSPESVTARTGTRRVGPADVSTLAGMSAAFADADHRLGGGHARQTVSHYLSKVALPLARDGSYTDAIGRALLSELARLCDLAGFMSFDAGRQVAGRYYLIQALRLAKASGNQVLAAHILTDLAMQAAYLGHRTDAVALAEAAVQAAHHGNSPSTLARSHAIYARTAATAGDAPAADKALNAAERILDHADRAEEPAWIGFFVADQLAVESMYVSHALGRASHVQRHARIARLGQPASDTMQRRDVLARVTLAESHLNPISTVQTADVEQACAYLADCAPLLGSLTSVRVLTAVDRALGRLKDFQTHACVRELNEALTAAGSSAS